MQSSYLVERLNVLKRSQNSDDGWAFYAGKRQSWLEPTVLAALVLERDPEGEEASNRAWARITEWQQPNGGWRPNSEVPGANWTTALAVLFASGRDRAAAAKGMEWLRNARQDGAWTWRSKDDAAAEPTALALVALVRGEAADRDKLLRAGREFLDGLASTPGNCGAKLVGLQGTDQKELVRQASEWLAKTESPLTRAWIRLGLRLHGEDPEDLDSQDDARAMPRNLAVVAWEALAARGGPIDLFQMEVKA